MEQSQMRGIKTMGDVMANHDWLREQMNPYFFIAMEDEPEALEMLGQELGALKHNRRLLLADRDNAFIVAMKNKPGSLYETLRRIVERDISYAMFSHSRQPLPGLEQTLEIQRFEFLRKGSEEIMAGSNRTVPPGIRSRIRGEMKTSCPEFDFRDFDRLLRILWLNNETYVRISPTVRIAQTLNLLQQGNCSGGLHLDVEPMVQGGESRVLFAVANPPPKEFLLQVMEVFNRLDLGVTRAYCLTINNGVHPYFLGTFYVRPRDGSLLERDSGLFTRLQQELYTTQILASCTPIYREWVTSGVMSGEDASLVSAFGAFCHANLAHNQPDRFGLDDVRGAFHANPEISLRLVRLFRLRFDPGQAEREQLFSKESRSVEEAITGYNSGHRYLDDLRRSIFSCCHSFIRHTLKSNFFVLGKQALSFRLDPAYLHELGPSATADLPRATPFRVTFFYSRCGYGFHIGFSDIARGGWRTVIARSMDDVITNATTLFREAYVLAHTQQLKNKDIYEGGSKLVTVLDASDLSREEGELVTWNLYKLQYGVINAFLDIFVTRGGRVLNPAVVDYYGEDEPIELGPDENMHDSMIETIASLSRQRGYLLGTGLISSKRVGINHKEYGVTSTGVVKFAEITMAELGISMATDPFSVKFTGGPNGDVAGNAMRIMLERSPHARIVLILDGTAALSDPSGADRSELRRILLKEDLDGFSPELLNPGGFLLFRSGSRRDGVRELYRKVSRTYNGMVEEWLTVDDFSREYAALPFTVPADLFIPAGGRPETLDSTTWERFLLPDGTPSARVIIEGANSFITPQARINLQKSGVIIMRDASANKCGVISSSFEIIANLLLSEKEFLADKERYVRDVLEILEKVSEAEARLILDRRRLNPALLCTDISDAISLEINAKYAQLFSFFQSRPELSRQARYRRAILEHLPRMLREESCYSRRIPRLPQKYISAILAAEIGSSMVYRAHQESALEDEVRMHLARNFK
jgi:glutamate dehydrogenase